MTQESSSRPAGEPIRVLRVITWLPVGGIERRLVATLPRLDRKKFQVELVCIRERGALASELEAAGVLVHLVPFRKRWDWSALRKLAALMRDRKIDIVHSHMYRSNVPATVAAKMAGVKTVWGQIHNVGTWETSRQAMMDRWLCRWRTGMIAVSQSVQRDAMATLRLPAERVPVIYNGVDLARFQNARARREEVRQREGIGPEDVVFLFAARLVEQKRCQDFLEAFGRIASAPADGSADDLHKSHRSYETYRTYSSRKPIAWILGDGPQKESLQKQAASIAAGAPPAAPQIRFFGQRDDIEDFMAAADAFVLPSTKEGFSNALVEAMAAGLPAIATDVGGNAEAVRDGEDGLIIPPMNVDRLASAMESLLADTSRRQALAASAAKRAEAFSLEKMIGAVERLYSQ